MVHKVDKHDQEKHRNVGTEVHGLNLSDTFLLSLLVREGLFGRFPTPLDNCPNNA